MTPQTVPDATFHTRAPVAGAGPDAAFDWKVLTTADIFPGRRVVLFALPGAFTPACSDSHLPGYERRHDDFVAAGVDRVVCLAVNDAFVMQHWARAQGVQKVFMLPDGNGEFTRKMGMLVDRSAQGMGMRSWRYSMLAEDGRIVRLFAEEGFRDNPPGVPVAVSGADTMLDALRGGGG